MFAVQNFQIIYQSIRHFIAQTNPLSCTTGPLLSRCWLSPRSHSLPPISAEQLKAANMTSERPTDNFFAIKRIHH